MLESINVKSNSNSWKDPVQSAENNQNCWIACAVWIPIMLLFKEPVYVCCTSTCSFWTLTLYHTRVSVCVARDSWAKPNNCIDKKKMVKSQGCGCRWGENLPKVHRSLVLGNNFVCVLMWMLPTEICMNGCEVNSPETAWNKSRQGL